MLVRSRIPTSPLLASFLLLAVALVTTGCAMEMTEDGAPGYRGPGKADSVGDAGPDGGEPGPDAGEPASDGGASAPDAGIDPAPTFEQVYSQVLSIRCAPCHTMRSFGGLSMRDPVVAYNNLVEAPAQTSACEGRTRVVPSEPESSLLLTKVSASADLCGPAMPPSVSLSEEEIALIESWIAGGANF